MKPCIQVVGYRYNHLDEPVLRAGSKYLLTEFVIHHTLESCEIIPKSQVTSNGIEHKNNTLFNVLARGVVRFDVLAPETTIQMVKILINSSTINQKLLFSYFIS